MIRTLARSVATLSALLVASPSTARTPPLPTRAQVDARVAAAMAATGSRSVAIAVVDHGRLAWTAAYGVRNKDGAPLQTNTIMYGASLTKAVFGYLVQTSFFKWAGVGIKDMKIVQVDQVYKYAKPIFAGDKLYCDLYVDSVRQAHGTDIVVLKNIVTNEAGDVVQETYTTLAGRTGDCADGLAPSFYDGVCVVI